MNRRTFLTRSGLALGALIVGEAALEELARLTHVRKTFPSAGVPRVADLSDWRYVRIVTSDTDVSGAVVTLQGSRIKGGGWRDIESQPLIGTTVTFKSIPLGAEWLR